MATLCCKELLYKSVCDVTKGTSGYLLPFSTYLTCRRSNKHHFWQPGCKQGAKHALFWSTEGALDNQLCAVALLKFEMKSKDLEMGPFKI